MINTNLLETAVCNVVSAASIGTTITRALATITATGTDTSASIDSYSTTTSFDSVVFSLSCSSGGEASSQCDTLTETTTSFPVTEITSLTYEGTTSTLELTESISTEVQVSALETDITINGFTTKVTLDDITTIITPFITNCGTGCLSHNYHH